MVTCKAEIISEEKIVKNETVKRNGALFAVKALTAVLLIALTALLSGAMSARAEYWNDDAQYLTTKEAYEYIAQQIREYNPSIDLRSYNILLANDWGTGTADTAARYIYGAVRDEYPDTCMASTCEIELDVTDNGDVYFSKLNLNYVEGYDMDAFYAARDEALSKISPEMTDEQKAVVLHDYIVSHCAYDNETYENGEYVRDDYTAYGVLVDHKAVCDGYSLAYKYLCNLAGVECYKVASDEMQHAWNMVVLDGEPYHVELINDDVPWDILGKTCHFSLFITDDEVIENGYAPGWKVESYDTTLPLKATSDKYAKAFWKSIYSPLVWLDGNYYFARTYHGTLTRFDIAWIPANEIFSQPRPLVKGASSWVEDSDMVWHNSYFVDIVGDRIVYNTPTGFDSCRFDGSDVRTDATVDTANGFVYGAAIWDGKLRYALEKTWVAEGPEEYIVLTDNLDDYWPSEINEWSPDVSGSSAPFSEAGGALDAKKLALINGAVLLAAIVIVLALAKKRRANKRK